MSNNIKVVVGGKTVDLNQTTYLAQGGEAVVHKKHGTAYKIYHDPSKMIAVAKIKELAKVTLPNILGPKEIISDTNGKAIGFTMPFQSDTEFLSRLFVSSFRTSQNITPEMIKDLVKHFQTSMKAIHAIGKPNDYLVVDNNEYNLLVSKGYNKILFIDVDSWKTPSFPATALMDSVRDRKLKTDSVGRVLPGQFSVGSDWFSFAVTATQIYLGCHPYKGRHPNYKPRDWSKMMDDGISVFNAQTHLPPNTQILDVIPPAHRKWLEGVLERGDRSEPPMPDQVVTNVTQPQVIFGTETFEITPVRTYDGKVLAARFVNGVCYAQTTAGLYADGNKLNSLTAGKAGVKYDFCAVQKDNLPMVLTYESAYKELSVETLDGALKKKFETDGLFVANDCCYTVQNNRIVELTATKFTRQTLIGVESVGSVLDNKIMGDGVISMDIFGKTNFIFPQKANATMIVNVKELDGRRILELKRINNIIIGLTELKGRKDRFTLAFDKDFNKYQIRVEEDTDSLTANFVVLDKGIVVSQNDDKAELFVASSDGVAKYKEVEKFPLTKGQPLFSCNNDVYFTHEKGLFKIALHK